jgi:hypothetical protein
VDAHYETPEQTDVHRMQAFEDLLFSGFEQLFPMLVESIELLDIDRSASPGELKRQLASRENDPLAALIENVRYARIRAGRYYFYVNAPDHFDVSRLFYYELMWIKKLTVPIVANLRTLLGDHTLSPEHCFDRLGLTIEEIHRRALNHLWDLAGRSPEDTAVPGLFEQAVDLFPHYYRLIEQALGRVRDTAVRGSSTAVRGSPGPAQELTEDKNMGDLPSAASARSGDLRRSRPNADRRD